MGVKLGEVIPKKQLTWEDLKGKVLAVDSSNMLYQFLSSIRQADGTPLMDKNGHITSHLVGLFSRVPNLMEKGIKLVFVFDGKPPELKGGEQSTRSERKEAAKEKYEEAIQEEDVDAMLKYSKQTTRLTKEMNEEAKELLTAMGLPVIQAPSEADAQMAYMNRKGDAWACATTDFDPLLHRAPRTLRNLTLSQKKKVPGGYAPVYPELTELKTVLETLEVDQDQLLIMSILVGTDYNPGGIKGIGPAKALKLIQSDKKFEEIFKEFPEIEFDWKEIVDTFKNMPVEENYEIEFKEVDEERVKELLLKHDFSEDRIEKVFERLRSVGKDKEQTGLDQWG